MPLLAGAHSTGRGEPLRSATAGFGERASDLSLSWCACDVVHRSTIRRITSRALKGGIGPSSFDSSSHGISSSLLVDTVLHVLGEDPVVVLTGLVTTTGNDTRGAVSTSDASLFAGADDLVQQQPIVF